MTRYAYLQNILDDITELQKHNLKIIGGYLKNKLLDSYKNRIKLDMMNMTIKEASKKAGFFFRLKYDQYRG